MNTKQLMSKVPEFAATLEHWGYGNYVSKNFIPAKVKDIDADECVFEKEIASAQDWVAWQNSRREHTSASQMKTEISLWASDPREWTESDKCRLTAEYALTPESERTLSEPSSHAFSRTTLPASASAPGTAYNQSSESIVTDF